MNCTNVHSYNNERIMNCKNVYEKSFKELVLPQIGPNWHDVKIYGMCTQCMLYTVQLICTIFCLFINLYNAYIKVCTFNIYDKPILQV